MNITVLINTIMERASTQSGFPLPDDTNKVIRRELRREIRRRNTFGLPVDPYSPYIGRVFPLSNTLCGFKFWEQVHDIMYGCLSENSKLYDPDPDHSNDPE